MGTDTNVLRAYLNMILDGTAFCNWKNPPTREQRHILAENILGKNKSLRGVPLDISSIQKIIQTEDEKELQRLMDAMEIKEDEFMV